MFPLFLVCFVLFLLSTSYRDIVPAMHPKDFGCFLTSGQIRPILEPELQGIPGMLRRQSITDIHVRILKSSLDVKSNMTGLGIVDYHLPSG